MKKIFFPLTSCFLLSLIFLACNPCQEKGIENEVAANNTTVNAANDSKPAWLFVTRAESGYVDGDWIVFNKPDTQLLYFSDRPFRLAGHLSLNLLAHIWQEGGDSFESNPPNAVLAVMDDEIKHTVDHEEIEETVITLHHVMVTDSTLRFQYTIVMGELPQTFNENTLFIDRRLEGATACATCPASYGC